MANQIARNFAAQGDEAATCDHLEKFWDPRMKSEIVAGNGDGLNPIAKATVKRLGPATND